MTRIQAKFFLHGCVLVKDEASIDRLQRSGIGARQLNPIITSVETIDGSLTSAGPLLLLDEEAFYLTHHGSLDVQTSSGEVASLDFLWSAFVNRNANFAVKYKVFAYYKDKSYVVRTGINFGVDYCAYHTLPSLCHSEMCITVVDATRSASVPSQNTASTSTNVSSCVVGVNSTANPLNLAWRHVTTLTRVVPDVNKICVICYVLPTEDAPHPPAPETQPVVSDTAAAEEAGMSEDTVSAGSSGGDGALSSGGVHVSAPTVSPYLATLFPNHTTTNGAIITTTTSTAIDYSSYTCLSALTVRPVTALVRRMPALSERYQTIKMIQEAYHAASTAQKKRELKALNKAKVGKIHNGSIGNGGGSGGGGGGGGGGGNTEGKKKYNKPYSRVSASAGPTTPSNTTDTLAANTSTITSSAAPYSSTALTNTTADPSTLLSADPATLSGRQKRIAKFLQKQALQQAAPTTSNASSSSALPKSKQMKERRDHRENRTKAMSNKNQSLLNIMQGGGGNGGGNSGNSGNSGTGDIGVVNTRSVKDDAVSSGVADRAGVKRPHTDVNTDTADISVLSYLSGLFYSQGTTTAADGAGTSTQPSATAAPGGGGESHRKRCRTQYAQNTVDEEDASSGYLHRAASYCVIS